MKQELIDYIKKEKNRGISSKQIKDTLLKAGHDVNTVDKHLNHVFKEAVIKTNKKKILIPLLIILILVLSVGFYYFKTKITENKVQDHINSGRDLYNQKRFEEAIIQFNNAIALNPEIESPYRGLGWCYYELKDYDKAKAEFNKALTLSPTVRAHSGLGWTYYKVGKYIEAEEEFKKALLLNPEDLRSHSGLGWTYYKVGKYIEAEEEFNRALLLNPKDIRVYVGLASTYHKQNKYEEIKIHFNKTITLDTPYDYLYLAKFYNMTKEYGKAKEYIDKCLSFDFEFQRDEAIELREMINKQI